MKIDKIKKLKNINDIKLKTLSPTLKQKRRYLKIKVLNDKTFEENSKFFLGEFLRYLGIIDFGKSNIWFIKEKSKDNILILRCSTKILNKILISISLIKEKDFSVEILKIGSTIKNLKTK